jgi:hypothetical protein
MCEENTWFKKPEDTDTVWRYIDLSQFMSIISGEDNTIWFTRVDNFKDPYEGMPSEKDFSEEGESLGSDRGVLVEQFQDKQEWIYANCWHRNIGQSDMMWSSYLSSHEGVAIKSTVGSLKSATQTSHDLFFANVNYIDWEKERVPSEPVIAPSLHKRECFRHENEMRMILRHEDWRSEPYHPYEKPLTEEKGIPVSVNLDELVDEVYTSPRAKGWFHKTIEEFTSQHISAPVSKSNIYEGPLEK